MEDNLVSIIVISYNHDKYILDCLKSINCQTHKNKEIIIIDNKSTDNTLSIINSYTEEKDKVTVIASDKNLGVLGGIELGLSLAKGDFITFFASDDIMIHDRLEKQVKFLIEHPEITGCFGNMMRIDHDSKIHKKGLLPTVIDREYTIDDILYKRIDLYSPTQLYRTKQLKNAITTIPKDIKIEDVWMYHKLLSKNCRLCTLPYLLTLYRIHSKNTHSKYKMMMDEKIKILLEYKNEPYFDMALKFIYLEHFSVFASYNKIEAIKIWPKIITRINSKYYWIGISRLLLDWRFIWVK